MSSEIVVGIDGSRASTEALRWALAEAELCGDSLAVVHAWTPVALVTAVRSVAPTVIEQPGEAAALVEEQLADAGRAEHPSVVVECHTVETAALPVLLERAWDARMLVVGTGRKSRLGRLVLGSVSEACAHQAACPVVVVPPRETTPRHGALFTVVVGSDGSPSGHAALWWAARESRHHDGVVELYEVVDAAHGNEAIGEQMYLRQVSRRLEDEAKRARQELGAKVTAEAVVGRAGERLCSAAAGADLLVVGRSGHHGIGSLVMGSVADHCVRNSKVPVAVIP